MTPLPIRTKPFKHQIEAYKLGITLDKVALLMEQGTGKSATAIAIMGRRYLDKQIKKVLIFCPLTVGSSWNEQFTEHADFPFKIVDLTPLKNAKRVDMLTNWKETPGLQVAIMNFDSSWRIEKVLRKWKPDLILVDESQKLKNPQSNQSKAVYRLGKKLRYKLILTGTPITESPLDVFGQYRFLDDSVFGTNYSNFKDRYVIMDYMGWKPKRFIRSKELTKKIHSVAYRITKNECLDLPPALPRTIYAYLEPKARKLYQQMKEEAFFKIFGGDPNKKDIVTASIILTQQMKLQQITGGFVKGESGEIHQVSSAKLKALEEELDNLVITSKRKLVIFARFSPEVEAISKLLKRKKIKHYVLEGKTPVEARGRYIKDFQSENKSSPKIMVIQIATGGLGITLTKANNAIFYSTGQSGEQYEQAKARLDRIGQVHKVTFIHLVCKDTEDEGVLEDLKSKRNVAMGFMDRMRPKKKGERKMKTLKGMGRKRIVLVEEAVSQRGGVIEDLSDFETLLQELDEELKAGGMATPREIYQQQRAEEVAEAKRRKAEKASSTKAMREKKNGLVSNKVPKEVPKISGQKPELEGDLVTVKELAYELKIEAKKIRKWLRSEYGSSNGRWEWVEGDPVLDRVRKLFRGN